MIFSSILDSPTVKWLKFFKSDAIVVKKGAAIEIPAEIFGLPLPTFEWTKNGVVIDQPTETMMLESEEINRQTINTKIGIPETVRQDTGIYKLTATNTRGVGQRTIRVDILGKPLNVIQYFYLTLLIFHSIGSSIGCYTVLFPVVKLRRGQLFIFNSSVTRLSL